MQEELTYEAAMRKFEAMAKQMEQGETGIEEMAERLREAQGLMEYCHEKLYEAEKNCKSLLGVEEKA